MARLDGLGPGRFLAVTEQGNLERDSRGCWPPLSLDCSRRGWGLSHAFLASFPKAFLQDSRFFPRLSTKLFQPESLLAASDSSGLQELGRNFTCSVFGQVFFSTCILGTVFSTLHCLRKEIQRLLLEVYFILVYSCRHGSCRCRGYLGTFKGLTLTK